jgi:hypothetical protein
LDLLIDSLFFIIFLIFSIKLGCFSAICFIEKSNITNNLLGTTATQEAILFLSSQNTAISQIISSALILHKTIFSQALLT